MDLHTARAAIPFALRPAPPRGVPLTVDELRDRLEAAGAAELGLIVRGTRPAGYGSGMPEILQDPAECYGYDQLDMPIPIPPARAITQMEVAMSWIALIPLEPARRGSGLLHSPHGGAMLRRIVLSRCYVDPRTGKHRFSWKRLAKILRCSPTSVQKWHATGLDMILAALHRRSARL